MLYYENGCSSSISNKKLIKIRVIKAKCFQIGVNPLPRKDIDIRI